MAIARLNVKVGKAGKAAAHAAYIAREGKYEGRLSKGEVLEATESGNMPAWAESAPGQFWRAADLHERSNGTTYREHELALPRELPPEDRAALVRQWVAAEIGERHAYQWAIHRPKAADGQDQPHAHLMFSERQADGIERGPDTYFKRYNAKAPERGGARKGHGPNAGKTLSAGERKAELKELRARWGALVNAHLERAGRAERIDMRSYAERGIDRAPEPKQLPSAWRDPERRGAILEFREATNARDQARAELRAAVPDSGAVLAERRAKADRLAALRAERLAIYGRPVGVPEQQPAPRAVPAVPKETAAQLQEREALEAIDRGPPGIAEKLYTKALEQLEQQDQAAAAKAIEALRAERRQFEEARRAHEKAEPMLFKGKWQKAGEALDRAGEDLASRESAAASSAHPKTIEASAKAQLAANLPKLVERADAERQAREAREREQERQAQAAKLAERERTRVAKDFASLALKRESHSFGFGDHSDNWKATPAELRDRIDDYIKLPQEQRPAALERINRDPKQREQIRALIEAREQAVKALGRSR